MSSLRVRVKVTEDNTRKVLDDLNGAVAEGIAAAIPGIINLADRKVRGYSTRIADSLVSRQVGPATWLIVAQHHSSHIAESGSRYAPAFPFLVPALLGYRGQIAKHIRAARG